MEFKTVFNLLFTVSLLLHSGVSDDDCDVTSPKVSILRVGKTRFYILQNTTRGQYFTHLQAKHQCDTLGLSLARIRTVGTDVLLGRHLEKMAVKYNWQDTWYWLDAKFDAKKEEYLTIEDRESLDYSNFFYRHPRPAGVGSYITYEGSYQVNKDQTQCIAYALPWPLEKDYGFQTSFDEKPCAGSTKRHAICEGDHECDQEIVDRWKVFTEGSEDYVYDGNWIFGDRRWIVNWKPRTWNQSAAYCEDLGLQLYVPGYGDHCLIPFLKLWTRRITGYHFWTGLKYVAATKQFLFPNGTVLAKELERIEHKDQMTRTSKTSPDFCVTAAYSYEYPNETTTSRPWSMMVMTPSNCKNPVGTICQHRNHGSRGCHWKVAYRQNEKTLSETAMVEFGVRDPTDTDDRAVFRSTYKQQFGTRFCPPKTRMVRIANQDWHKVPENAGFSLFGNGIRISGKVPSHVFAYDYAESYWVVDEDKFDKPPGKKCTLSQVANGKRVTVLVDCMEWHFYLCENITAPASAPRQLPPGTKPRKVLIKKPRVAMNVPQ